MIRFRNQFSKRNGGKETPDTCIYYLEGLEQSDVMNAHRSPQEWWTWRGRWSFWRQLRVCRVWEGWGCLEDLLKCSVELKRARTQALILERSCARCLGGWSFTEEQVQRGTIIKVPGSKKCREARRARGDKKPEQGLQWLFSQEKPCVSTWDAVLSLVFSQQLRSCKQGLIQSSTSLDQSPSSKCLSH